jgi:hypothetical protein
MERCPHKSGLASRPTLAGASVLLVLGLLVSASADPLRTASREVGREHPDRTTVRELTATLAKAVRTLVETASQKAVASMPCRATAWDRADGLTAESAAAPACTPSGRARLRHDLLDLPPPVIA